MEHIPPGSGDVLSLLFPGIPAVFGSLAGGRTSDFLRKRAVRKHGSESIPPERRISTQIYGYLLSAAGLLMYGWFCRFHIHVSAALVASAIGKQKIPRPSDIFLVRSAVFLIRTLTMISHADF